MPNGQTTIIPFYLLMVKFHWINTFWPLIIPWWAPPLSIFLMRQYISAGIHDDLIDASRLDGAGLFQTYWRVVVPLSAPGLVVIGVMQFISVWNEFLYGLLVLKSDNMRTVTVAITELSRRTQAATVYGPSAVRRHRDRDHSDRRALFHLPTPAHVRHPFRLGEGVTIMPT